MASAEPYPGVSQLVAQLSEMTEQDIKAALGSDFLVRTQAALGKAKTSGKVAIRKARVEKRKRVRAGGANSQIVAVNAANGLDRVAKPCNSFLCFRCKFLFPESKFEFVLTDCSVLCHQLQRHDSKRGIAIYD